jgi:hypothetical protein
MKVKKLLSVALVLLCGIMFFGCSGNAKPKIESDTPYFLQELVLDTFAFKVVKPDDRSFLKFGSDFKEMTVRFDDLGGEIIIKFVITSCEQKNGQIKGTASRLQTDKDPETGKLVRYSFWSDDEKIYLQTLTTYKIYTVYDSKHTAVTVNQDSIVAYFWRNVPSRIGGGG